MDANQITQIISNVGFPIAASVGLFYLYDKTLKEVVATMADMRDTLKELNNSIRRESKDGQR